MLKDIKDIGGDIKEYLDPLLINNIDQAVDLMKHDWDIVILMDGMPGAGKSTFAMQIARYVDPNFNIDNICFFPEEFMYTANFKLKRYSAIIFDEAYRGLSKQNIRSYETIKVLTHFQECRQNNHFIILVSNYFNDLARPVATYRSRALINVFALPRPLGNGKYRLERGYYGYVTQKKKAALYNDKYVKESGLYAHQIPKYVEYKGRFKAISVLPKELYEMKKRQSLQLYENINNYKSKFKNNYKNDREFVWGNVMDIIKEQAEETRNKPSMPKII